jgi:Ca2+-binding EF-hand superfamily protein
VSVAEPATYRNALALPSTLQEYRLDAVLGAGGFGITYLGWDGNLEKQVAIKEYLPTELAVRALDGSVVPVNTASEYNYKWGLERFSQEARTLARFSHPNIVRVNRFFDANNTSYMVMDYQAGESVYQYLKRVPEPGETALKAMLMPILDGLEAIHQAGFLHRDIKPSNVFLRENGAPVLIDFGAARLSASRNSKVLTAIVSPGYAPLEQYSGDGNQGPWSDIYALSGVLYRAVTGDNPPDAVKRLKKDDVPTALAAARARYDERFLKALEWGLKVDEKLRPQSVAQWRELFSGRLPMSALNRGVAAAASAAASPPNASPARNAQRLPMDARRQRKWGRRSAFVVVGVLALAVLYRQHAMEREIERQAAQQAARPAPAQRPVTQRFEAADTDRSGSLSREEMAQRLPRFAARFDEMDTNRDGMVTLRELEQFLEKDGGAEEIKKVDETVARGQLVVPEAGIAAAPAPPPRDDARNAAAEAPAMLRREFIVADRDGDGFLSVDEVRARFPALEKRFGEIDRNRDGRLSLDELWQYRRKTTGSRPPP